jgi:cyclohexanecarboxylate-CoA ligase
MRGYLNLEANAAFLALGGWYDTGDLARMDEQGYIRITGRSKDVIIRGGENIPVVEIESLLYRHPAVAMAAVL